MDIVAAPAAGPLVRPGIGRGPDRWLNRGRHQWFTKDGLSGGPVTGPVGGLIVELLPSLPDVRRAE